MIVIADTVTPSEARRRRLRPMTVELDPVRDQKMLVEDCQRLDSSRIDYAVVRKPGGKLEIWRTAARLAKRTEDL